MRQVGLCCGRAIGELCASESRLNRETVVHRSYLARVQAGSVQVDPVALLGGLRYCRASRARCQLRDRRFRVPSSHHQQAGRYHPRPPNALAAMYDGILSRRTDLHRFRPRQAQLADGEDGTCRSSIGSDRNFNPSRFARACLLRKIKVFFFIRRKQRQYRR